MTESKENDHSPPTRAYAPFTPKWQRFHLQSKLKPGSNSKSMRDSSHQNHPYARQYSHVYSHRLESLRKRCLESANASLNMQQEKKSGQPALSSSQNLSNDERGKAVQVTRIIELKEGVKSTVVGTLVKDTPGRPVVDTDYHSSSLYNYKNHEDDDPITLQPLRTYANEEKDVVILEDESGRVELLSQNDLDTLHAHKMVTGMVVAVTGVIQPNTGVMIVDHIHYPTLPPQSYLPSMENGDTPSSSPYVMLVSGLHCGSPGTTDSDFDSSLALRRALLIDYIAGHTNSINDAVNITRLIIAGGGCTRPNTSNIENDDLGSSIPTFSKKLPASSFANKKNASNPYIQSVTSSIQELDLFVAEVCSSGIPTDLIPGLHDPTNSNFPQQPLHSCVLPYSSSFGESLFQRTTNPYEAEVGRVVLLGSDGRNVMDLRRFTFSPKPEDNSNPSNEEKEDEQKESAAPMMMSSLQALEQTLLCSHSAPTAPDSLHCFPFYDEDPFVMESCPHIYFAGNCPSFETKLIERSSTVEIDDGKTHSSKCRLICIPSFALTGEAVMVNLDTLECVCISFNDVVDDVYCDISVKL